MAKRWSDSWHAKAALAASILEFRNAVVNTLDQLLVGMIREGADLAHMEIKTNGVSRRPVIVSLAIGDTAVREMDDLLAHLYESLKKDNKNTQ